ncbi:MAG TPA: response regulator transcription factor [Allosphingosinicella sp.]|jgi:DNA-binding LytR/AlgR family response regulator
MIRILIADDESVALQRLEIALNCVPEMTLVAKAANGAEALRLIREVKPDIAVLDIQMPGCNGLGVVGALKSNEHIPEIIFVTAFEQHAIRAFELNAVDYLLKPVAFERFRDALRKAKERLGARTADIRFAELEEMLTSLTAAQNGGAGPRYESEIWVRERDGLTRLPVETIDFFEAAGDYVIAHVGPRSHLISESISSLQSKLDPTLLLRVHRCSIVNLRRIRSLRRRGRRGLSVLLSTGAQIAVGPTYTDTVLQAVAAKRWR